MKPRFLLPCVWMFGSLGASAAIKLPAIFSDHLVLQREAKVPVWGWADAGEEVAVTIAGKRESAKAGADGKWRVQFIRPMATALEILLAHPLLLIPS